MSDEPRVTIVPVCDCTNDALERGETCGRAVCPNARKVPLGSLPEGAAFSVDQFPEGEVRGRVQFGLDDDGMVHVSIDGEVDLACWAGDTEVVDGQRDVECAWETHREDDWVDVVVTVTQGLFSWTVNGDLDSEVRTWTVDGVEVRFPDGTLGPHPSEPYWDELDLPLGDYPELLATVERGRVHVQDPRD